MTRSRSRFTATNAAERGAALRAQREAEQAEAIRRREEMAGRDKSPTGIVRGRFKFDEAKSAVGSLNRKIDEAIDEVRLAFQREAQMEQANNMAHEDDAQRAPVLENRRVVH